MEDKEKKEERPAQDKQESPDVEATWAHDALAELEDFIESQGIYIRQ